MALSYVEFLDRLIEQGIAGARADYLGSPDPTALQRVKFEGSEAGFLSCKGKSPEDLARLLEAARHSTGLLRRIPFSDDAQRNLYWRTRCSEVEIAWVANCVSAALEGSGYKGIVPVTALGFMQAARILGTAPITL